MQTVASPTGANRPAIQPVNLTIRDAATYCGCSTSEIYRRIHAGELKFIKSRDRLRSKIFIPKTELDRWNREHLTSYPSKPRN